MNFLWTTALTLTVLCFAAYAENSTSVEKVYPRAPIKCYVCNSHEDVDGKKCEDPIDKSMPQDTCKSGLCLKYVQEVEDDIEQTTRSCAEELEPIIQEREEAEGCILSTGTKNVHVQICNCITDGCNGGAEIRSATSIIIAAVLLCILAKLVH